MNCTNGTRFQFGPYVASNSDDAYLKATSYIYEDVYANNTRRRFFRNGTRAMYKYNGYVTSFVNWEVAPTSYYETCTAKLLKGAISPTPTYWPWDLTFSWKNCSVGANSWNATLYQYEDLAIEDYSATPENRILFYTGAQYETYFPNGTMRRVFRNGTIAIYQYNSLFYAFNKFEKAPTSLYVDCTLPNYEYGLNVYDETELPIAYADFSPYFAPLI